MINVNSFKHKARLFMLATLFFISGAILLTSCEDEPAPQTEIHMDKHGAIDMNVRTLHQDGFDVLVIEKVVYDESGSIESKKYTMDTMKSLSVIADTLSTGRTYEDENGENQEIDTIVHHPKNYQIYITVK